MEDNFSAARLESIRKKEYYLKQLRNNTTKQFIIAYLNSEDKKSHELKKATYYYIMARKGMIYTYGTNIEEGQVGKLTEADISKVYIEVQENAELHFVHFYESYRRKVDRKYADDFKKNAFSDLKTAYFIYRKVNFPKWNLEDYQITEAEIDNLYNILSPKVPKEKQNKDIVL